MTPADLKIGGRYNWKNQPEKLIYIGVTRDHTQCRGWYQFALVEAPDKVWCEVRPEDLNSFEETGAAAKTKADTNFYDDDIWNIDTSDAQPVSVSSRGRRRASASHKQNARKSKNRSKK